MNEPKDPKKSETGLDRFLRAHRPGVPDAPRGELELLLRKINPPAEGRNFASRRKWIAGTLAALAAGIAVIVMSPWVVRESGPQGQVVESSEIEAFALEAFAEPLEDDSETVAMLDLDWED